MGPLSSSFPGPLAAPTRLDCTQSCCVWRPWPTPAHSFQSTPALMLPGRSAFDGRFNEVPWKNFARVFCPCQHVDFRPKNLSIFSISFLAAGPAFRGPSSQNPWEKIRESFVLVNMSIFAPKTSAFSQSRFWRPAPLFEALGAKIHGKSSREFCPCQHIDFCPKRPDSLNLASGSWPRFSRPFELKSIDCTQWRCLWRPWPTPAHSFQSTLALAFSGRPGFWRSFQQRTLEKGRESFVLVNRSLFAQEKGRIFSI